MYTLPYSKNNSCIVGVYKHRKFTYCLALQILVLDGDRTHDTQRNSRSLRYCAYKLVIETPIKLKYVHHHQPYAYKGT